MKKQIALLTILLVLGYTSDGWCPPPTGGGTSGSVTGMASDGSVAWSGAPVPDSAGGQTLGTTSAEWGHIYLGNAKSVYFQIDQSVYLTGGAGTLTLTGGNLLPGAATLTLGSTAAEWGGLYLGDAKVIYFQADQSVYLTPAAGSLTLTAGGEGLSFTGSANLWTLSSATDAVFTTDKQWSFTANPRIYDGSHYLTLDADGLTGDATITFGANTNNLKIDNGTAGLDIAAAAAVNVDTSLTVQTGAVTLTGNVAGSTLVMPSGSLTLGTMAAETANQYAKLASPTFTGSVIIPSANADPASTAGSIVHDSTVTNHLRGAIRWYDGTGIRQVVDLTAAVAEGCTDDYVVAYDSTADAFYCKADATGGGTTMVNDTVWAAKGDLAVASANDTGTVLSIGTASTLLKVNTDTPGWTSTTITEAANAFALANGTANVTLGAASVIDVAAGKTADINYNFTVNTGDVTLTGPFSMAAPGAVNAVLCSDGTDWTRCTTFTMGALTVTSLTISKTSGAAGDMGLYEANSTDTHAAGFRGPDSITGDGAYRIKFPDARAAAAGQVLAVTNAGEAGAGTAISPYIQTGSWITPLVAGTATGGLIFGDDSPDAAGEIGYDGDLKYYDAAASRTVANLDKTQTFTNKTLTSPVINTATGSGGKFTGDLTGLAPAVVVLLSSGVHDGGNDAAFMTDGGIELGASTLIGMTVYNITDASSCTITANAATTITCTLAGGTDNNWDDGDVWQVGPGPSQSGSVFYVAGATTARHPATVGYAACYVAEGTNKLTIDFAADMVFTGTLDAAVTTTSAGHYIASSDTTTDDFICLHNKTATAVKGLGKRGTWSKEADD